MYLDCNHALLVCAEADRIDGVGQAEFGKVLICG